MGIASNPPSADCRSGTGYREDAMKFNVTAGTLAAASLLALGACAPQAAQTPTPTETASPTPTALATPDPFANALNYECENAAGTIDVIRSYSPPEIQMRVDGGAGVTLPFEGEGDGKLMFATPEHSLTLEAERVVYKKGSVTRTCTFKSRSFPAPTVEGAKSVTEADAGKTITLKVGEKALIALSGTPTAGFAWAADATPDFLKTSDGPGGATSTSQMLPGFTGGNHWESVLVEAVKPGSGELVLAQRRPWEPKSEPGATTFKVTITVE